MTIQLMPFQEKLIKRKLQAISKYGAALNASEMGLGKTLMTIACLKELKPKKIIIVCPASLRFNWVNELLKFNDNIESSIQVLNKEKDKPENKPITIVSYSLIIKPKIRTYLLSLKPDCVVVDEAHYIKSADSKRTQACLSIIERSNAKAFFLTGTPITNKPLDIFPLCQFMARRGLTNMYFNSYWPFVKRYCDARPGKFGWIVDGASNIPELREFLAAFMAREEKANVLPELPAKIVRTIPVVFDTEKAKKYAEETRQLVGDDFDISKLKFDEHIASARVKLGELKVPAAVEHINNILLEKKKVVVFAWHKSVMKELAERLTDFVLITGDSSQEERKNAVDRFQNGDAKIFLGNISAAGVGLTLTAADHVVMVEHDWTPANNYQAEDRIHRIGQASVCVIDYLIAKNSLEHKIFNSIHKKDTIIREIMK